MKQIVIGFLGCGNVGGGVWELLQGFAPQIAHRDQLSHSREKGAGAGRA